MIIENVDYDMLVRYLSKRMTKDEIISENVSELLYEKKLKRKTKHTNEQKNNKIEKTNKKTENKLGLSLAKLSNLSFKFGFVWFLLSKTG